MRAPATPDGMAMPLLHHYRQQQQQPLVRDMARNGAAEPLDPRSLDGFDVETVRKVGACACQTPLGRRSTTSETTAPESQQQQQ
jgi:hypothetical protein